MAFDLSNLSPKDLDALISNAKQRKVALKKRKPVASVREKLAKAAAAEGYTLDELFAGTQAVATPAAATKRAGKRGAKRGAKRAATSKRGRPAGAGSSPHTGSKVPAKYRNPANPSEVWTGRGMAPRWMAEYLKQGKTKDDFLI